MSSSQAQQSDDRQRRFPDLADRGASESVDPENKSDQRTPASFSLEESEMKLSHYLHYEDNACFFAPSWQGSDAGRDRAHTAQL
ncbi:hypothetical protein BDW66DRAFT_131111 [Aspergillus desertorum]